MKGEFRVLREEEYPQEMNELRRTVAFLRDGLNNLLEDGIRERPSPISYLLDETSDIALKYVAYKVK